MHGILSQDRRLAGMVLDERKGLVIAANKWDLARAQGSYSQAELTEVIHEHVPFASFAPVTFLSALTGRRLGSLMPVVLRVAANLDRRIPTARLNAVLREAVLRHPPPIARRAAAAHLLRRAARRPPAALRLPLQRTRSASAVRTCAISKTCYERSSTSKACR